MFEFLGTSNLVHLIHEFMDSWNKVDEAGLVTQKRLKAEYEEKRKKLKVSIEAAAIEIDQERFDKRADEQKKRVQLEKEIQEKKQQETAPNVSAPEIEVQTSAVLGRSAPTIADISKGTGLSHDQIRQTMKDAEDQFVHWPHPERTDMTRYAMREHAEEFGLENWQPGTGF